MQLIRSARAEHILVSTSYTPILVPDRFLLHSKVSLQVALFWICYHGAQKALCRVMTELRGTLKELQIIRFSTLLDFFALETCFVYSSLTSTGVTT